METWNLLFEIVILLGASLVLGGLCSRFGQSPLIGYLLAGMLLGGPGSINVVESESDIESIAELGVSLLLFGLGLEFSVSKLKALGRRPLLGGVLQVGVTLALGALIAALAGLSMTAAIAVGAMVSLSSTAVVLRVLMERAELETPYGRNTLGILLVQDMAVVPLAVLMGLLAGGDSTSQVALNVGKIVGLAAILVVSLHLVLNVLAVRVLGTLTIESNRELSVILAVVTGLGATIAAHEIGISPALGAFVAGLFLGSSPFATQIRADISSLRVVLLTLFFGAAGMVADPIWILTHLHWVLGVLVLLTVGKTAIIWGIFRFLGVAAPIAAATGVCLAQIGEFAFVLGKIAKDSGVITPDTHLLIVSVAIASLFSSPLMVPAAGKLGVWLAVRLARWKGPISSTVESSDHKPDIVVVGYGPAGRIATQDLVGGSQRVLVIDLNREGIQQAKESGFDGHIGDATQLEVLEHAGVAAAKLILITVPHFQASMITLQHVRRLAPAAHCMVRSRYQRHTNELVQAGAHRVLGDEEQIGTSLAFQLGIWLTKAHLKEAFPDDEARSEMIEP